MKKKELLTLAFALVWVPLACEGGLAMESDRTAGAPNDGAGSDGDVDMDVDGDGDADSDADEGDGYPPEKEEEANYMAPQGSGRYVFIADESHDSVVVVDSETLEIQVIEVGARPTHLVPLSKEQDGTVAVINLDSDEVTLIEIDDEGEATLEDLPVRPDTNALVPSPDGRFIIAFHDPRFTAESGTPTTDQEITVLDLGAKKGGSTHLAVGMHPWQVVYNEDVSRAFVVSEEGISIIDLTDLGEIGIPPIVAPFEGGSYDSTTADIEITPDGSLALARVSDSAELVAAWLDDEGEMRTYTLEAVPTDLDIAPDGSFGVMVLRYSSQVALFDLPLPEDAEEDPFTLVDIGETVAGVATVSPDGKRILLHTTTAGGDEDQQRLTCLSRAGPVRWDQSSVVLERKIKAVAAGVDSETAVIIHQPSQASGEHPYSYSLVTIPDLATKFQQIPVQPGQLLLTPDGDYGFLLLEDEERADVIDLNRFIVDGLILGSPPTAAGYAAETDKVFIAQDHPSGRMTFVGVHDDSVKTVTGYNLNDDIEY